MTTARPDPADDEDFVIPDEEDIFLEEMGLGSDGEPITLADPAWNGLPYEPDEEAGVF